MPNELVIDETGFATVKIGEAATATVDLYSAYNQIVNIFIEVRDANPGASNSKLEDERLTRICALMETFGLGTVSQRSADLFETAIFNAVNVLKKTPEPPLTPNSPPSTEPMS